MRFGWMLGVTALAITLVGCGKFMDKFARINGDITMVHFDSRGDEMHAEGTLNGGLMIYFIDQSDTNKGRAFGFASEDELVGKSVILPNGTYRAFAFSWEGTNKFVGTPRCALGDDGLDIVLSGAAKTVRLSLSLSNCQLGNTTHFSLANQATASGGNFDFLALMLCDGNAYSCSPATSGTWYLKAELLGGVKPSGGEFNPDPAFTLSSACSSGGTGTISTNMRLPVGGTMFSPPMRIKVFADSTCSVVSGTYDFLSGIKQYLYSTSASTYSLEMQSTNDYYYLKVPKNF